MLATKAFVALRESAKTQGQENIVIKRKRGIAKEFIIPARFLSDTSIYATYGTNTVNHTIDVVDGETVLMIADEIGVKGEVSFEITYLTDKIACIELTSGTIFTKNANDAGFGFDVSSKLVQNTAKVRWFKVEELYPFIESWVMARYNVDNKEAVDYIYNATFKMTLAHTENAPSVAKTSGCYWSTRYLVEGIIPVISMGEFDFITFEKPEIKRVAYDFVHRNDKPDLDNMTDDELAAYEAERQREYEKKLADKEAEEEDTEFDEEPDEDFGLTDDYDYSDNDLDFTDYDE